jgi:hypothetical protein
MKYLKTHPIHENDSHLSDMTIINKDAEKTVITQDRDENTDNFQHLSNGTKIKNGVDSTVNINGEGFQKLSKAADMEVNPSDSKPQTDGKYQRLQQTVEIEDAETVNKIHSRSEDGDGFQRLSDAPEKDNVSSTFKQNDSDLDQRLSDIAESRIVDFTSFK